MQTEYDSAIKMNEILPFATAWMDLRGIMLSEISQLEKRKILYDFTYIYNLKNKINKTETDSEIQRTD